MYRASPSSKRVCDKRTADEVSSNSLIEVWTSELALHLESQLVGWLIKTGLLVSRYDISIFITNLPLLQIFPVTGERKPVLLSGSSGIIKIFVAMVITLFAVRRTYFVLPAIRIGVHTRGVARIGITVPALRIVLNSPGVF